MQKGIDIYLSHILPENYNILVIGKDIFISYFFCRKRSSYVEIARKFTT